MQSERRRSNGWSPTGVIIMGDLNCKVGQEIDYIESDDGDRFLNLPFLPH